MHSRSPAPAAGRPGVLVWQLGLLMGVFCFEAVLFLVGTSRHYAWIYPRRFDQVQYLQEGYRAFEAHFRQGWLGALGESVAARSAQGELYRPLSLLAFMLGGPTRLTALSLNLWAFVGLQAALFFAVRRLWSSWSLAWVSVGLLAALSMPWSGEPGSATDFRLDWMAACAFGVAMATLWSSGGLRSVRGALSFGVAVALVLLLRFLTGAYLLVVFAGLAVWIGCGRDRVRRECHLLLAGLVAAALAGWAFWRSRAMIHEYYVVGHFTGSERRLRDSHIGGLDSLLWVSREAGANVGVLTLAVAIGGALVLRLGRRADQAPAAATGPSGAVVVPGLFLVAPCLVLCFQPEKASQVMSIVIPGAVGLLVALWASQAVRASPRIRTVLAAGTLLIGLGSFAFRVMARTVTPAYEAHYRSANALADFLVFRSEEAGLGAPRVAVTGVADGLGASVLEVNAFERHGRPFSFIATLPDGLFTEPAANVQAALANSDFVCLLTQPQLNFPIDRQLADMAPANRRWCEQNLHFDGEFSTSLMTVAVFERPQLERPQGGGADLVRMVQAALADPKPARVQIPGAAHLLERQPILWSRATALDFQIPGVYSPMTYRADELPPGLRLDGSTGKLTGQFPRVGRVALPMVVTNAVGSSRGVVEFEVGDQPFAVAAAAERAADASSVVVRYRAFAADGTLDFIDIADLTTGKLLTRLTVGPAQKTSWQGTYSTRLENRGSQHLLVRFVRFTPGRTDPYPYLDQALEVAAAGG